jgi:hypothetical protein
MFKFINAKSTGAIVAAAFVAGLAAFLTSTAQEANAEPQVTVAPQHLAIKGDRLAQSPKGAACSSRGWPNYEQACQFDVRRPGDEAKTVRVIALR